jgi:hypothetical protein
LPVVSGHFLTAPTSAPAPFAEIGVLPGTLTVAVIVHAGIENAFFSSASPGVPLTGNVTLRAGSDAAAGAVVINGSAFAANGGTVSVSAGFNPTNGVFNGCGATACMVRIDGSIWGDQAGALQMLAAQNCALPAASRKAAG